jgi:hypothetical protein
MATRTLALFAGQGGISILQQGSEKPVIRGIESNGDSYLCGSCSAVLAERLRADAVWDVGFRCHACGAVSLSPELPPGRPLPQNTVMLDPRDYLIWGTIDQRQDAVLAGRAALERRLTETGIPQAAPPQQLDAAFLEDLAARGSALLGSEFEKLDAAYRRGLTLISE